MLEFPKSRLDWRFDVISLLAVIGESSMDGSTQPLTASFLCLLPRIIPAPQALLKSSRPTRLPAKSAQVVGVHSGTVVAELNYFADLLHPIAHLPAYEFRELTISHNPAFKAIPRDVRLDQLYHASPDRPIARGMIKTRRYAPLKLITVGSALLSLGLLVWAILLHDGVACLAILFISVASSVTGIGSLWRPRLMERRVASPISETDVVVRTRHGACVVVHCTEEVARELYTGAEECSYAVGDQWFKALVGLGTALLMVSVVLMGNCTWVMQCALGAAYIGLNGLYWVAALTPRKWHWDLGRYVVETNGPLRQAGSFTQALWFAIRATGATGWVGVSHAAPDNPAWRDWLVEAHENLDNESWDAQVAIARCMQNRQVEMGMMGGEKNGQDREEEREVAAMEIPDEGRRG